MYKIPANTLFIGKEIVFMPQCQSTNSEAIALCANKAVGEGTIVITNHQLAGRGQRGNNWESTAGLNLTFSIVLTPKFLRLQEQFMLNIITSLAIHDCLAACGVPNATIKWPNDVMVNGKKIAGILTENQVNGSVLTYSVIGIGLNVNQDMFDYPTATSLRILTNTVHDLNALLINVLEKLEVRYIQLRNGNIKELISAYEAVLYWKGEEHTFYANGKEFLGTINEIDGNGQLVIDCGDEVRTFGTKQVEYRK